LYSAQSNLKNKSCTWNLGCHFDLSKSVWVWD